MKNSMKHSLFGIIIVVAIGGLALLGIRTLMPTEPTQFRTTSEIKMPEYEPIRLHNGTVLIETVIIDKCEYVVVSGRFGNDVAIVHKADCRHNLVVSDTLTVRRIQP